MERRGLLQGWLGAERSRQATIGGPGVCAAERRGLRKARTARLGGAARGAGVPASGTPGVRGAAPSDGGRLVGALEARWGIAGSGVLISGRGSNLQAIIDSIAAGRLDATIAVVISNRADAAGLARAARAGIETLHIDHKGYGSREAFDRAVAAELRRRDVALVCLAGFMRLLSPEFVDAFPNRILNIHPSLLPAFPGLDGQAQAWEHGVKVSGATVHIVTPELDAGPIVRQAVVPVDGSRHRRGARGAHPGRGAQDLPGGDRHHAGRRNGGSRGGRFIAGRGVDDA